MERGSLDDQLAETLDKSHAWLYYKYVIIKVSLDVSCLTSSTTLE